MLRRNRSNSDTTAELNAAADEASKKGDVRTAENLRGLADVRIGKAPAGPDPIEELRKKQAGARKR